MGRIKRLQRTRAVAPPPAHQHICPLCDRPIPAEQLDAHHFVPRSQGGKETRYLHRICHRQVHALFTEFELARHYATPEALRAHPDMARFLVWVSKRPPGFQERVRGSERKRDARRGAQRQTQPTSKTSDTN